MELPTLIALWIVFAIFILFEPVCYLAESASFAEAVEKLPMPIRAIPILASVVLLIVVYGIRELVIRTPDFVHWLREVGTRPWYTHA